MTRCGLNLVPRGLPRVGEVEHVAVFALKRWLVIEGVDLAGAAGHEQEDHAFGPRRMVQRGERLTRPA